MTKWMSIIAAVQGGGFVCGPLVGIMLTFVDLNLGPLQVNFYTSPGLLG